jgi:hypothetical protein
MVSKATIEAVERLEEDENQTLVESLREKVLTWMSGETYLVESDGYLHRKVNSFDRFSPLGVLCHVYQEVIGDLETTESGRTHGELVIHYHENVDCPPGSDVFPPAKVLEAFDLAPADANWIDDIAKTGLFCFDDIGVLLEGSLGWEG